MLQTLARCPPSQSDGKGTGGIDWRFTKTRSEYLGTFMRHLATSPFFTLWLTTAPVAGQVPDCGRAYQGMLSTIERKKPTLSVEAQIGLQRMALRLYDACLTGHLEQPGELFDKFDRSKY